MWPFTCRLTWKKFFQGYFEQSVLIIPQALTMKGLQNLFLSNDEVAAVFAERLISDLDMVIVRKGIGCNPAVYRRDTGQVDFQIVNRLVSEEWCTMYIRNLGQYSKKISSWCNRVNESLWPVQMQVNRFFTPAEGVGLLAHIDPHDSLIVQQEGEKVWEIWLTTFDIEAANDVIPINKCLSLHINVDKPDLIVRLKPGDMLYVPRTVPHRVYCEDSASVHYNIWLRSPTLKMHKAMEVKYEKSAQYPPYVY